MKKEKPNFHTNDIVWYDDLLWIVKNRGTTFLHNHPYAKLVRFSGIDNSTRIMKVIGEELKEIQLFATTDYDFKKNKRELKVYQVKL